MAQDNRDKKSDTVLENSRVEQAVEAFYGGCNCAQAVFSTYADLFGIDGQTAMNLTNSMGGGISRLREVCGTVSAIALLTGLAEGAVDPGDLKAREKVYQRTRDLLALFEAENGSLICRELLGKLGREASARPSERTAEYYKKRPCGKFVACAARIIEKNLWGDEIRGEIGKSPGPARNPDWETGMGAKMNCQENTKNSSLQKAYFGVE